MTRWGGYDVFITRAQYARYLYVVSRVALLMLALFGLATNAIALTLYVHAMLTLL